MNRRICTVLAAATLALGLAACEEDVDGEGASCTSNDDCSASQSCEIPEGETAGVCTEIGTMECSTNDDCGAYVCSDVDYTCGTMCEDDSACSEGNTCDTGECRAIEYRYIAIVSGTATDSEDVTDTNTPGPDLDAVELSQGGVSYYAAIIESSLQGTGGDPDNANDDVTAIIGANDVVLGDGSDCSLDEGQGFWSMGDFSGYVIVTLDSGIAIEDGAELTVYELSADNCPNVNTVRDDAYSVHVGLETVDVSSITSADMITGDSWLNLGSSPGTGGTFESTFAVPTE